MRAIFRWWLRRKLVRCGCALCVANGKILELMWEMEKLYTKNYHERLWRSSDAEPKPEPEP